VVLEFEGLFALGAFEFAKNGTLVVANHVSLQSVHVGKLLVAHFARLKQQQQSSLASKKFTHTMQRADMTLNYLILDIEVQCN
jgi:hypothetical protein